jgi:hypothetical protein
MLTASIIRMVIVLMIQAVDTSETSSISRRLQSAVFHNELIFILVMRVWNLTKPMIVQLLSKFPPPFMKHYHGYHVYRNWPLVLSHSSRPQPVSLRFILKIFLIPTQYYGAYIVLLGSDGACVECGRSSDLRRGDFMHGNYFLPVNYFSCRTNANLPFLEFLPARYLQVPVKIPTQVTRLRIL